MSVQDVAMKCRVGLTPLETAPNKNCMRRFIRFMDIGKQLFCAIVQGPSATGDQAGRGKALTAELRSDTDAHNAALCVGRL